MSPPGGPQEFLLGEWSCLQVVLDLIDSRQQGQYWCPALLQRAALAFLLALWQDRRDSAISVLRTKYDFLHPDLISFIYVYRLEFWGF